jgi:hypothetical protein
MKKRNPPPYFHDTPSFAGLWPPLFFLASLVFWGFAFYGRLPAVTDTLQHVYPDKVVDIQEWRKGALPLWNAQWGCGMPQMAVWQSMCFYPFAWIWGILGNPDSLVVFCLFHNLLAFLGGHLWLKSQGARPLARGLGALSFAGSALAVECWGYPHHSAALCGIPWIFWASQRLLEKPQGGRWLWLVFFISLQLLAGYPIFVFYTLALLLAWLVSRSPSGNSVRNLMMALFFSLLLSSLQWLPFLELLANAKRGGWWSEFPFFMKPWEYLTLFKPDILGWQGSSLYRGTPANFAFNLYLGIVPLVALFMGCLLFWIKGRLFRFWPLSSLAFLLWMGGRHFPLWGILPEKLLEWLEPSKSAPLFLFCASTGAALAFSNFFQDRKAPGRNWLLGMVAFLWLMDLLLVPFRIAHPLPNPYLSPQWNADAQKIARLASGGRILSLAAGPLQFSGNGAMEKSVEVPVDYFLADSNAVAGVRSASFFMSISPEELENLLKYTDRGFPYLGDFLDAAGVRLFLLPQPLHPPKYLGMGRLGDDFLSLDPSAPGNMWYVSGESVFVDRPALLNILAQPNSGWRDKVFLEGLGEDGHVQLAPPSRNLEATLVAGFSRPNNSRAAFQGDFSKAGYVVFNETFWPGWRAWVDGKPAPILRAYGLFMAVAVEAGGHQVDLRYEPAAFRLGLFIAILTLAALSAGLGVKRKWL